MADARQAEAPQGFFQHKQTMLATSFIAILIAFALLVIALPGLPWLYWAGLVLLVIGFLLAPLSRYTAGERGDEGEGKRGTAKDEDEKEDKRQEGEA